MSISEINQKIHQLFAEMDIEGATLESQVRTSQYNTFSPPYTHREPIGTPIYTLNVPIEHKQRAIDIFQPYGFSETDSPDPQTACLLCRHVKLPETDG